MQTKERLAAYALKSLRDAQTRFKKNPNAANWNACLEAMIVYQQAHYVTTGPRNWDSLYSLLDETPQANWDNVVCRVTMHMTIPEALKAHAYN